MQAIFWRAEYAPAYSHVLQVLQAMICPRHGRQAPPSTTGTHPPALARSRRSRCTREPARHARSRHRSTTRDRRVEHHALRARRGRIGLRRPVPRRLRRTARRRRRQRQGPARVLRPGARALEGERRDADHRASICASGRVWGSGRSDSPAARRAADQACRRSEAQAWLRPGSMSELATVSAMDAQAAASASIPSPSSTRNRAWSRSSCWGSLGKCASGATAAASPPPRSPMEDLDSRRLSRPSAGEPKAPTGQNASVMNE